MHILPIIYLFIICPTFILFIQILMKLVDYIYSYHVIANVNIYIIPESNEMIFDL